MHARRSSRRLSALFVAALAAFAACSEDSSDDAAKGDPADCPLIANRCHPYDDGSNLAHECHEVGHEASSAARCTEMKAECLAACPERPRDAGAGGTGSGGAPGGDGGEPSAGGSGGTTPAAGGSGGSGAHGGTSGTGSGNGGAGGEPGSESACEQLGRLCHGIGPGFTEECHEIGHDGDEALCEAELEECLAACVGDD